MYEQKRGEERKCRIAKVRVWSFKSEEANVRREKWSQRNTNFKHLVSRNWWDVFFKMVHAIANNFHYICNGSFNFNHKNFKFILLCLFNFDKSRLFDDYNLLHGNQSHLNTPIQHFLVHLSLHSFLMEPQPGLKLVWQET